jgi:hypothetical protein
MGQRFNAGVSQPGSRGWIITGSLSYEPRIFTDLHGAAKPQLKDVGIGIAILYRSLKGDLGD